MQKFKQQIFGDFLAQILKREAENREVVRRNRNLKSAGFDVIKTFEDYVFKDIQVPQAIDIDDLKTGGLLIS